MLLIDASSSRHSKRTKGASASPFPWYLTSTFRASSFRPTDISQRGDWFEFGFRLMKKKEDVKKE
jgi:hypothetical protein